MMFDKKHLKRWMLYFQRMGAQGLVRFKNKSDDTLVVTKPKTIMQLQALFQSIDKLQKIILSAKEGLGTGMAGEIGLETLGVQTYLFHMGRVLIQIREQAYHFQYRINQLPEKAYLSQGTPFEAVLVSSHKCQQTIMAMINVIHSRGILKLANNKKFFVMVNTLELNASELSSNMRHYNQFCIQKETLNELFDLDKLFLENFLSKSKSNELGSHSFRSHYPLDILSKEKPCMLMEKMIAIEEPLNLVFVKEIIGIFHDLKKCYVVSRKSVINNTLCGISDDIEELISAMRNIDEHEEVALRALHSIYSGLESIRFSTNTESRCSRNLFDKSKLARTKLRQACLGCDIGQDFLKQISLRKIACRKSN